MEGTPKFNPRSDALRKRDAPVLGDDIPCEKCGGELDTGFECIECAHDNYAAMYGEPRPPRKLF